MIILLSCMHALAGHVVCTCSRPICILTSELNACIIHAWCCMLYVTLRGALYVSDLVHCYYWQFKDKYVSNDICDFNGDMSSCPDSVERQFITKISLCWMTVGQSVADIKTDFRSCSCFRFKTCAHAQRMLFSTCMSFLQRIGNPHGLKRRCAPARRHRNARATRCVISVCMPTSHMCISTAYIWHVYMLRTCVIHCVQPIVLDITRTPVH